MNCFVAPPIITGREEEDNDYDEDDDGDDDYYSGSKTGKKKTSDMEMRRGAILADDMGIILFNFKFLVLIFYF